MPIKKIIYLLIIYFTYIATANALPSCGTWDVSNHGSYDKLTLDTGGSFLSGACGGQIAGNYGFGVAYALGAVDDGDILPVEVATGGGIMVTFDGRLTSLGIQGLGWSGSPTEYLLLDPFGGLIQHGSLISTPPGPILGCDNSGDHNPEKPCYINNLFLEFSDPLRVGTRLFLGISDYAEIVGITYSQVDAPSVLMLLSSGLIGLIGLARRKKA